MRSIRRALKHDREIKTVIWGLGAVIVGIMNKWRILYVLIPIGFLLLHLALIFMKTEEHIPALKSLSFVFYAASIVLSGRLYDLIKDATYSPNIVCFIIWILPVLWLLFDLAN